MTECMISSGYNLYSICFVCMQRCEFASCSYIKQVSKSVCTCWSECVCIYVYVCVLTWAPVPSYMPISLAGVVILAVFPPFVAVLITQRHIQDTLATPALIHLHIHNWLVCMINNFTTQVKHYFYNESSLWVLSCRCYATMICQVIVRWQVAVTLQSLSL